MNIQAILYAHTHPISVQGDGPDEPANAAGQHTLDLGEEDRKELRWRRQCRQEEPAFRPGDEQQQVATGHEFEEHDRLQLLLGLKSEIVLQVWMREHPDADQQQTGRFVDREYPERLPRCSAAVAFVSGSVSCAQGYCHRRWS